MGIPTWMFHPQQPAKIVDSDQIPTWLAAGWFESPDFKPKEAEPVSPVPPISSSEYAELNEEPPKNWKSFIKPRKGK